LFSVLSFVIGKFPDEFYVTNLLSHKEYNQVTRLFGKEVLLYMAFMAVLFVCGVAFQLKSDGEEKKEKAKNLNDDENVKLRSDHQE